MVQKMFPGEHSPEASWGMESVEPLQCTACRQRFYGEPRCNAYPDGIPIALLTEQADHREPYPGDRGVRFAPLPPSEPVGMVRFTLVLEVQAPGDARLVGAVWYCRANDALGFVPFGSPRPATDVWRQRVYRGGEAADRGGGALFEQILDLCDGFIWDCTPPREAADLFAVQAELASMV